MSDENKQGDFYRERFFIDLSERLDRMEKNIDIITDKIGYVYGFAAAVGIFSALLIEYVKSFFKKGA